MAELLIRAFDSSHANPVKDRAGCYKRGHVCVVMQDGHQWGREELDPRKFSRLRVPDLPMDAAQLLLQPELGSMLMTPTGDERVTKRRRWSIDLDALPSVTRMECEAGDCGVIPWPILQSICKESVTQLSFSPIVTGALLAGVYYGGSNPHLPPELLHRAAAPSAGVTRREMFKNAGKVALVLWVGSVLEGIGFQYFVGEPVAHALSTRTRTVKSAAGDYSTLSAWEAGEQGNLTSLDEIRQAECYALADTTAFLISGWTTDATRYIRIYVATGEGHAGVWDDAKYKISTTASTIISNLEDYVTIEGLQMQSTVSGAVAGTCISNQNTLTSGLNLVIINKCLMRGVMAGSTASAQAIYAGAANLVLKVRNTIIYDWTAGTSGTKRGVRADTGFASQSVDCQNVTIVDCVNSYVQQSGTFLATNCGSKGHTTAFGGTITQTTCSSSAPTFVNEASDNFLLDASDSAWKNQGTDLSSTFIDDVTGDTRTGTWDIGADGVESVGGGTTPKMNLLGVG